MRKRVIFFDVDGVLNCATTTRHIDFYDFVDTRKVLRLRELARQTKADLVLCSSWRLGNVPGASHWDQLCFTLLREDFRRNRFDWQDQTPWFPHAKRWKEINAFLVEHPEIEQFIILDDYWQELKPLLDHTVITTEREGFNKAKFNEAIALFKKQEDEQNVQ